MRSRFPMELQLDPENWQKKILEVILRLSLILGSVVLLPSAFAAIQTGLYGLIAIDLLAIGIIAGLLLAPRFPFRWRAGIFCLTCYSLGVALLVWVGPVSQIYLFGFSILTTVLLGLRAGFASAVISSATLFAVGFFGAAAPEMALADRPSGLGSWVAITLNFALVSSLLTLAIGGIIGALNRTLKGEVAARISLERERALSRALFDALPDLVFTKDLEGRFTSCNPATLVHVGLAREDQLIGKTVFDFFPREIAEAYHADDLEVFANRPVFNREEPSIGHSGNPVCLLTIKVPLRSAEGAITGLIAICRDITGRKREEAERLRLLAQLQLQIQRMPLAYLLTDSEFRYTRWNPAAEKMFGYSEAEVLGKHPFETVVLPESRDRVADLFERIRGGSLEAHTEAENATKGGGTIYCQWHNTPLFAEDGSFAGLLSLAQDISVRRRAEDEARQAQTLRRIAGQVARIGGWELELPSQKVTWSDEICAIHDEPAGHRPLLSEGIDYYAPEYRDRVAAYVEGCARDGTPFDFELEMITAKQRRIWVRSLGEAVRDSNGSIVGLQGAFQDITDRKRAEEDQRQLAERLNSTLESIKDGFFTLDRDWRFTYYNSAAERMTRRRREEVIGVTLWDAFPGTVGNAFEENYRRAVAEQNTVQFTEYYAQLDGWFEIRIYPFEMGLAVYFLDVSASRQVEQALRASEERFRFLNEVGEAVRTLVDADRIMAEIARMLGEYLRASRCAYADMEKDENRFTIRHDYTDGCASTVGSYELTAFGSRAVATLKSGETLIVRNVEAELSAEDGADTFKSIGIRAIVTCPLVKNDELRALMAVHQTTPRDWTSDEVAIIQQVVERCWSALERQTAERNLRRSEASLIEAQRIAKVGNWDWNIATDELTWSAQVFELFGIPPNDFQGKYESFLRGVHPEDRSRIDRAAQDSLAGLAPYDVEHRVVWPDGTVRIMHERGEVTRDAEGRPLKMTGTVQDITERKRAEAERNRLLAQLQLQIERMPLGYILADSEFRYTRWNPTAVKMFGYPESEAIGRHPFEIIVPPQSQPAAAIRFEKLRAGGMDAHGESENRTKSGGVIVCEWHNTPMFDESGAFSGVMSLVKDITERKQLENQLRQSQKMEAVGRLAGGVAHDFNNLLTVITGYSELELARPGIDPDILESIRAIRDSSARAAALTRQLLGFSRQTLLQPVILDLNAVVLATGKLLRRLIGEDIAFSTTLAPNLSRVRVDPSQLDQILMNLAINARDAMPKGGQLTIETSNVLLSDDYAATHLDCKAGHHVMLAISDSGHGMAPEVLNRVFEPFYTTKGVGQGTGLGLAMVFGIVQQSGGCIHVYSEPDRGTSFKIYLPAVAEPTAKPMSGESKIGIRGTETILLVEDEESVRALALLSLKMQGYRVLTAVDGRDALKVAESHGGPLDLILTDVVMPNLGGPEMIAELKVQFPRVKVLYMSGYTDDAVVRHGLLEEEVEFIQKPYTPLSLARKVREVLDAGDGVG